MSISYLSPSPYLAVSPSQESFLWYDLWGDALWSLTSGRGDASDLGIARLSHVPENVSLRIVSNICRSWKIIYFTEMGIGRDNKQVDSEEWYSTATVDSAIIVRDNRDGSWIICIQKNCWQLTHVYLFHESHSKGLHQGLFNEGVLESDLRGQIDWCWCPSVLSIAHWNFT